MPSLKKSLGQNFLNNPRILEMEARLAPVDGLDVVEIGAGDGRLSRAILAKGPKKLTLIEKDPEFASLLEIEFSGSANVEIKCMDFLDFEEPCDTIFGNVPYYISSPILFKLTKLKFGTAVLMLQKEFVDRIFAEEGTKDFGRLSLMSNLYFDITRAFSVSRGNFMPMPKHHSSVIVLRRSKARIDEERDEIINLLFQQKKKTVANAVKLLLKHHDKEVSFSAAALKCTAAGIALDRHFHTLAAWEILDLAKALRQFL